MKLSEENEMKKIAVLLGGSSPEKDISLKTGTAVSQALEENGYVVARINPAEPGWDKRLETFCPDLVFVGLHGPGGEDGTIQGYLQTKGYRHTGSGVQASALAMNKILAQRVLGQAGLPVPRFMTLDREELSRWGYEQTEETILNEIGLPLVVKAPSQGSTIGISFVHNKQDLRGAIDHSFSFEEEILLERFIEGMEITVSVLGNRRPVALPTLEITTTTGVYDYESKYTPGMSDHIIPARLPADVRRHCRALAEKAYRVLGMRGFGRVDMMVGPDHTPYVIEANTIPGMTETSLIPDAARAVGMSFGELVEWICRMALGEEIPEQFRTGDED